MEGKANANQIHRLTEEMRIPSP